MRIGLTWMIYSVCVLLAIDGLAWLTWRTVQAERSRAEAQARVIHQQRVQLALWRLDSSLAWMLRAESGRASELYQSFIERGASVVASPLLSGARPPMRLYVAWTPEEGWSSPQVPTGEDRERAERLGISAGSIDVASRWLEELAEQMPGDPRSSQHAKPRSRIEGAFEGSPEASAFAERAEAKIEGGDTRSANTGVSESFGQGPTPRQEDLSLRARRQSAVLAQRNDADEILTLDEPIEGALRPFWLEVAGDETALVLIRDARLKNQRGVVGVWVDWRSLQAALSGEIVDLLPSATLIPITNATGTPRSVSADRLAMIPARIVAPFEFEMQWSGLSGAAWASIATSWSAVLAAVLAVGVVLWQALALSTRRARFASAVSHELRTPLTALRLQADLMPPSEPRAGIMREQIGRLESIVESVLAYAGVRRAVEQRAMPLGEAVDPIASELEAQVQRAGGTIRIELDEGDREAMVQCDPTLLHRVLMNLIANSCAHARSGQPIEVSVRCRRSDKWCELIVADNGKGIAQGERRRVFRAFVGETSGGLGLGLALARQAAMAMGGRLTLERAHSPGAAFTLGLRRVL